jgi:hypothetical protein
MTGLPEKNFPLFRQVAEQLRDQGHEVHNPADTESNEGKSWEDCIAQDIQDMLTCEAVAVLPGWQDSRGANVEVSIMRSLGRPVYDALTMQPWVENVAQEASRVVVGARRRDYDTPYNNHVRIAKLWSIILEKDISPAQVAMCMIMLKMAREMYTPKRDNLVDGVGYLLCLEEILEQEKKHSNEGVGS